MLKTIYKGINGQNTKSHTDWRSANQNQLMAKGEVQKNETFYSSFRPPPPEIKPFFGGKKKYFWSTPHPPCLGGRLQYIIYIDMYILIVNMQQQKMSRI